MTRRTRSITIRVALAIGTAALLALGPLAATTATAAANTDRLNPGEQLNPDDRLISPNGEFVLVMQGDGNLVEYAPGNRAVWATGTSSSGSIAMMQTDGNFVVIAPGNHPVWASGSGNHPNSDLELQNDGNIVVYAPGHVPVWASGTQVGPTALTDRIVTIANNEAGNPNHNHETTPANCNYYSGQLGSGTPCANGWRAEEWCADFARWVWGSAGADVSGLSAMANSFENHNWHGGTAGIAPGDVVGYTFGGDSGDDHVGVVVAVGSGTMTTIEGNYSDRVEARSVSLSDPSISGYYGSRHLLADLGVLDVAGESGAFMEPT
jgi:CHAP domain